jgi:hypothetical protein
VPCAGLDRARAGRDIGRRSTVCRASRTFAGSWISPSTGPCCCSRRGSCSRR